MTLAHQPNVSSRVCCTGLGARGVETVQRHPARETGRHREVTQSFVVSLSVSVSVSPSLSLSPSVSPSVSPSLSLSLSLSLSPNLSPQSPSLSLSRFSSVVFRPRDLRSLPDPLLRPILPEALCILRVQFNQLLYSREAPSAHTYLFNFASITQSSTQKHGS